MVLNKFSRSQDWSLLPLALRCRDCLWPSFFRSVSCVLRAWSFVVKACSNSGHIGSSSNIGSSGNSGDSDELYLCQRFPQRSVLFNVEIQCSVQLGNSRNKPRQSHWLAYLWSPWIPWTDPANVSGNVTLLSLRAWTSSSKTFLRPLEMSGPEQALKIARPISLTSSLQIPWVFVAQFF